MNGNEKISIDVVTGTGSCGTSFFIELLAKLNLTDIDGLYFNDKVKGGYEYSICSRFNVEDLKNKRIIKDPRLYFGDFNTLIDYVDISLVWLCYRDFNQVSKSRIARELVMTKYASFEGKGIDTYSKQINLFEQGLIYTIDFLTRYNIPLILVDYESLHDPFYCWKCIIQSGKYDVSLEQVEQAHKEIYNVELKHVYK